MAESEQSSTRQREEYKAKWTEIIKNSQQIAESPLKKYRLNTIEENLDKNGLVRRSTFGKKDPNQRNKTILMVGETGTGKSTLINMMVNYMLGVKWEDDVRFEIVPDKGKRPQTESQTDETTVYEIFGLKDFSVPFSLTVIDTPGYGDTRGIEHDKRIAENLYTLMKSFSGVQQLDAVCLMVKSSQNRLCERQKYIFDAVLSIFGEDMKNNIMTLITFSDWVPPSVLSVITESGVPCAKLNNGEEGYFLFNNLPLQKPGVKYERAYETNWEQGAESMHDFFHTLNQMETRSLKMTEKVLKERLRLETSIQSLMEQARNTEHKQIALEEIRRILDMHKNAMDTDKNFEYKYCIRIIKEEDISNKATRCTECKVNCHYPGCWWVSDLSWCSVMQDNKCTVCPGKCHYTKHVKDNKIYVSKLEERIGTYEDLKIKAKIPTAEGVMLDLQRQLEEAEAEKAKLMEEAYQCIVKLKEYALKFKSDSTKQHIVYLISMFNKAEDTEKAQVLKEML